MFALMFLLACFPQGKFEYEGDYPALYTVGAYSTLGARGFIRDHHVAEGFAPYIEMIEMDSFGRVLFSYSEGVLFLVIMQKSDGEYAYFYPHYNNILNSSGRLISDEDSNALKDANSWNQEMGEDEEFDRVRIVRRKDDGPIADEQVINVYRDIFPITNSTDRQILFNDVFYFRTDSYGRSIYLFTWGTWVGVNENVYEKTYYTVLFQADHSFDIESGVLEIEYQYNYQTELRLFMEANGWNTPP